VANDNIASIPDLWAREGLRVLTENAPSVMAVNRQYEPMLASEGETVKAHRPARRKIRRKTDADEFTANDAVLESVDVKLDQYFFDSFIIKDRELSLSIARLTETHLVPVVQGIARGVDRAILGRGYAFMHQGDPRRRAGKLNGMTKANSADFILEAQEALHTGNAPNTLMTALVHQTAQTKLQANELFASAEKRGSSNTLTTGRVGTIYNTLIEMSQNVPYVYKPSTEHEDGTVLTGNSYAAGHAATIALTDDFAHTIVVGEFFTLDENGQPTFVTVTDGDDAVTLNEPLKYAVAALSTVTVYFAGANEATERVAGYQKEMAITHGSGKNLQVGQLLAFGTGASRHTYTIIETTNTSATVTSVLLDRPLDATVAASAACFPGPAGAINPVLHPDALAFVSRPLATPGNSLGAFSSVQSYNGLGLRVTMQYDSSLGGVRVNVDLLAGIAPLDTNLLCPLLS